jgi:hypothetical protein
VQYCFEIMARSLILENYAAHRRSVQMSGWSDHFVSKADAYIAQSRLSRRDYLAGDNIGIDNRNAEIGEHVSHKGLAAGNATGQADTKWGLSGLLSHSEQCV